MRALRWACDSYLRLGVAVGALVLLALIISHPSSSHHASKPPRPARAIAAVHATTRTTSTTVPATTTTVTTVPAPTTTVATPALPSAASTVAIEFVSAWSDRLLPSSTWHRQVDQFCTPSLAQELASTLPANIPAGVTVTGMPTGSVDSGGGEVAVPTSAQPISLILVHTGSRWLVDTIE